MALGLATKSIGATRPCYTISSCSATDMFSVPVKWETVEGFRDPLGFNPSEC